MSSNQPTSNLNEQLVKEITEDVLVDFAHTVPLSDLEYSIEVLQVQHQQRLPEDSRRGYKLVRIMYDLLQHSGFTIKQLVGAIVVAEAEAGKDNSAETHAEILEAVGRDMVRYVEEQRD